MSWQKEISNDNRWQPCSKSNDQVAFRHSKRTNHFLSLNHLECSGFCAGGLNILGRTRGRTRTSSLISLECSFCICLCSCGGNLFHKIRVITVLTGIMICSCNFCLGTRKWTTSICFQEVHSLSSQQVSLLFNGLQVLRTVNLLC